LSTLHERALRSLVAAPRAVKRSDRAVLVLYENVTP
jgi:hypothetical protein